MSYAVECLIEVHDLVWVIICFRRRLERAWGGQTLFPVLRLLRPFNVHFGSTAPSFPPNTTGKKMAASKLKSKSRPVGLEATM